MQPTEPQPIDYREFPILYVDDEPDNLRVFELTFRRKFQVLTASTPEEGLRILHENPIALILSDYRMPAMNGVEFLTHAREIDERCIRMLVTAFGDVNILGDAINDGRIYRYIPKPWEPAELDLTLRRAIETYSLERQRAALLHELSRMNGLSHALHRELDLQKLLDVVLDTAYGELGFDGAAILLAEGDGEALSWAGFAPGDTVAKRLEKIEISRRSAPEFLAGLAAGEVQSLRLDAARPEAPISRWVTEVSADEILVVPLIGKTELIGALAVDHRSGGQGFGADDHTLLDGLAMHLVIALENARLVQDLTSTREQVKRADRLGTLGTLAAGLAHEINNPLVSIHTFLTLAPEKRSEPDEHFWGEYHQLAASELERIRGLVSTMSRLAHGGRGEVTQGPVDLGVVAGEVTTLLGQQARVAGVELDLDVSSELRDVVGVRDHLHQVLLNLVCNAIHATPEGGSVSIRVGPDPAHPADRVRLSIADTGAGIPEEDLERIFDPFFTTKDPNEGTGLGLMITHQIVADHGGSIGVESKEGQGARFRVTLPVKGVVGR